MKKIAETVRNSPVMIKKKLAGQHGGYSVAQSHESKFSTILTRLVSMVEAYVPINCLIRIAILVMHSLYSNSDSTT